ncbi:hypothetical protein BDN67DRAFT_984500 [Paxillus ammoniavirescens]|nr:hypothetical protein BDN67DRAFT_984500 [Paxillus ammoniavirescens]
MGLGYESSPHIPNVVEWTVSELVAVHGEVTVNVRIAVRRLQPDEFTKIQSEEGSRNGSRWESRLRLQKARSLGLKNQERLGTNEARRLAAALIATGLKLRHNFVQTDLPGPNKARWQLGNWKFELVDGTNPSHAEHRELENPRSGPAADRVTIQAQWLTKQGPEAYLERPQHMIAKCMRSHVGDSDEMCHPKKIACIGQSSGEGGETPTQNIGELLSDLIKEVHAIKAQVMTIRVILQLRLRSLTSCADSHTRVDDEEVVQHAQ